MPCHERRIAADPLNVFTRVVVPMFGRDGQRGDGFGLCRVNPSDQFPNPFRLDGGGPLKILPVGLLNSVFLDRAFALFDGTEQFAEIEGLLKKIAGAETQGLNRFVDAAMAGHDDDLDFPLRIPAQFGHEVESGDAGHSDVDQGDPECLIIEQHFEGFGAVGRFHATVAVFRKAVGQHGPDRLFVVED